MTPLSNYVEDRREGVFPAPDREQARALLVEECGENIPAWSSAGLDRLRCVALKLSHGKLDNLQQAIDLANRDFRDVRMAAEFGEPESHRSWQPRSKR